MSMEQRVRRSADRMSSRSFVKPRVYEECKKRKCEETPQVQGFCFAHWQQDKERKDNA